MAKKHDLPAMPFYWGDWFKCPEVRALTPAARCLWFEMLGLMWESTERGYLTLNGIPMDKPTLGRVLNFASDLLDSLLAEMVLYGVYSVRSDGAIYNRRMVRDVEISLERALAGKRGGFAKAKGWQKAGKRGGKSLANTEDENESENASDVASEVRGVGEGERSIPEQSPPIPERKRGDVMGASYCPHLRRVKEAYPKVVAHHLADSAWAELIRAGKDPKETADTICEAVAWQKKKLRWIRESGKWIPDLHKYLSEGQYLSKQSRAWDA